MSRKENSALVVTENMRSIRDCIFTVRGVQVMVDWDLAALYGVETRVMNQSVKRNEDRFPERFRFRLSQSEMDELITIVISPDGSSITPVCRMSLQNRESQCWPVCCGVQRRFP